MGDAVCLLCCALRITDTTWCTPHITAQSHLHMAERVCAMQAGRTSSWRLRLVVGEPGPPAPSSRLWCEWCEWECSYAVWSSLLLFDSSGRLCDGPGHCTCARAHLSRSTGILLLCLWPKQAMPICFPGGRYAPHLFSGTAGLHRRASTLLISTADAEPKNLGGPCALCDDSTFNSTFFGERA